MSCLFYSKPVSAVMMELRLRPDFVWTQSLELGWANIQGVDNKALAHFDANRSRWLRNSKGAAK
jgi:hypothetical protein